MYGLFIQQQFPKYLSYGTKSILVGDSSIIAVASFMIAIFFLVFFPMMKQ